LGRKVKLAKISADEDAEITRAALEDADSPEWTEDDFREARPVTDFPELAEILRKAGKLGRPPLPEEARKARVTLYLDRDVLERLKADGRGWQTRANAALRKALGL
jgi:uncharacterized protein (DUF4415 family)